MEIEIDLNKSVEENAEVYYEKAKKAKKKLKGAGAALEETRKKLAEAEKEEKGFLEETKEREAKKERKKEWYEKFHWFESSEGFLCIGGKDATSNEIVVKKHMEKGDIVFHTEMAGSPFFIVKKGQGAGEATLKECAQATAAYSRGWKRGLGTVEVYVVEPEQVSKTTKAGEYMPKGAFMIQGKRRFFNPKLELAIGLAEGRIIGGPEEAVKKKTGNYIVVVPGREKKSELAKKIKYKLGGGELDEIIGFLPGEGEIKK